LKKVNQNIDNCLEVNKAFNIKYKDILLNDIDVLMVDYSTMSVSFDDEPSREIRGRYYVTKLEINKYCK
jgi:hypothetical protein